MTTKIRQGGAALALIVLVSIFGTTIRAVARAGPLIKTHTVAPSPSPSFTPSPSPSETPSKTPTETPKPTETMSAEQALYATRGWATTTPTKTPYPIILPCADNFPYITEIYEQRVILWLGWVQRYKDRGYHDLPVEIPLAVLMHESRGSNRAIGASCEVGLFQIIPGDASSDCPQIPENPKVAQLIQSSKNVYHGIGRLEEYSWEGHWYIIGEDDPPYRAERYVSYPQASNLKWWYSSEGRATLAMFQCGPQGLRDGICNERIGGYVYAENILSCWVPWIQEVIEDKLLEE